MHLHYKYYYVGISNKSDPITLKLPNMVQVSAEHCYKRQLQTGTWCFVRN